MNAGALIDVGRGRRLGVTSGILLHTSSSGWTPSKWLKILVQPWLRPVSAAFAHLLKSFSAALRSRIVDGVCESITNVLLAGSVNNQSSKFVKYIKARIPSLCDHGTRYNGFLALKNTPIGSGWPDGGDQNGTGSCGCGQFRKTNGCPWFVSPCSECARFWGESGPCQIVVVATNHPQQNITIVGTHFFMDLNRTVIIFIASMRVLCLWIRATRAAN